MSVHPTQIVPPAGVQLPQVQFVINWMSSEGKLSHLVRCDITLLRYFKASLLIILSIFYLFVCFGCVCFICVLFIVRCYLCLYVVLFV
jgi:hypothetical protein